MGLSTVETNARTVRGHSLPENHRTNEVPHEPASHRPHSAEIRCCMSDEGVVRQCAHCRRVQHRTFHERWDWVPDWVEHLPNVISHRLCPICHDYYYPNFGGPRSHPPLAGSAETRHRLNSSAENYESEINAPYLQTSEPWERLL
jgi:hypothetical protein